MTRHMLRLALAPAYAGALLALAACQSPTRADSSALYGRWDKLEKSMPPVTLEVRRSPSSFTGAEGQVWLSGVTYTLPATVSDTSVVLADPVSSAPAPFVAVLQKDGTLRARLSGTEREERLVKRND
jgi:hypothetical protein